MGQVVNDIIQNIASLPAGRRRELVDRLIASGLLCESSEDALLIASRRDEPTKPYRQFRRSLKAKGARR